jgi:hypothetical protein
MHKYASGFVRGKQGPTRAQTGPKQALNKATCLVKGELSLWKDQVCKGSVTLEEA